MEKLSKFVPLIKVEEQPDGTLFVYGRVTAEQPDRDGEICKYTLTVPFYKAVNTEFSKATKDAGIEESIMPLREMHQLSAVGCGKSISFDDDSKSIEMGFAVVDPAAITKVKKGVYTGFSQGGAYVKTWKAAWDGDGKTYTWYIANPGEVSLVDSPCLPSARFEYVKSDGAKELRKFTEIEQQPRFSQEDADVLAAALAKALRKDDASKPYGDVDYADPGYQSDKKKRYPLDTEEHIRAAWSYIHQGKNADKYSSDHLAHIHSAIEAAWKKKVDAAGPPSATKKATAEEAEKLYRAIQFMQKVSSGEPLEKGMYEVANMASVLGTISYLQSSAAYERDCEGDESVQPEEMTSLLNHAITCFTAMVAEETSELSAHAAATSAATKGAKAMTQEELKKAADELLAKAKGAHAHLTALQGHLDKMHKVHGEHVETAHDHLTKADAPQSAHDHLDRMHKAVTSGIATAHEHIKKCMKALGAVDNSSFNDEPTETDTTAAGGAHTSKSFDPDKFAESLLSKIDERIDGSLKAMITAMFSTDEDAPKVAKADGVGDRELVPSRRGPVATIPVTKAADVASGTQIATSDENKPLTPDEVRKAMEGDPVLRLRLAKLGRQATGAEASRIETSLSMASVRRG